MNVETEAVAAQFPGKEYLNGIAVAVHGSLFSRYRSVSDVYNDGARARKYKCLSKDGGKNHVQKSFFFLIIY
jgi:hypothetical protein